jgi:hypothetical protein
MVRLSHCNIEDDAHDSEFDCTANVNIFELGQRVSMIIGFKVVINGSCMGTLTSIVTIQGHHDCFCSPLH